MDNEYKHEEEDLQNINDYFYEFEIVGKDDETEKYCFNEYLEEGK